MFDFAFSCIPREQYWWFSIYAVRINPLYFQISLVLIFSLKYLYPLYSKVFPLFIYFIDWTTILKFYLGQTNLHHATDMILQLNLFWQTQNTKNSTKIPPKDFQNWLSLNAHQSSLVPRLHAELHAVQSSRVVQWPFLLIEFVLGMRSRGGRHSCNGNPSEERFGCFNCFGMFQLLWVASVVSFAMGVSVVSVAT